MQTVKLDAIMKAVYHRNTYIYTQCIVMFMGKKDVLKRKCNLITESDKDGLYDKSLYVSTCNVQ